MKLMMTFMMLMVGRMVLKGRKNVDFEDGGNGSSHCNFEEDCI
jgi:hypothetical protein